MSNTTPIEKCHIGEDAKLTVKLAKEKGWSKFSIYPNGNLIGTSPEGIADESVPNFARILCDAAPDLLAALERIADPGCGCKPVCRCNDSLTGAIITIEGMREIATEAIAKAKGE